jgi:hypothetical protein
MSEPVTKDDLELFGRQLKTELKQELIPEIKREMMEDIRRLIQENSERLIELMQASFARMDQRFDESAARAANSDSRLRRHADLLRTGSRWSARMNDWAERIDAALAKKDEQIASLSERVRKLEEGRQ